MARPTPSLARLISEGLRHGGDLVGQELELMRRETDGNIRAILGLVALSGRIVTVVGLQLGFMLGGVVVVETIFAWPGIGRLALTAVEDRDYTVLQGAVLYLAITFLVINLLVDILYAALDPRAELR